MRMTLYNVELVTARDEDLELIRYWRNSQKIQRTMEYRELISTEQHHQWFREISDHRIGSIYTIIYNSKKIGVVYARNKTGFSEGGMFIWDDEYLNTMVPVVVSLMYTDISFLIARNEFLHIKILSDNFTSIAFNIRLGYVLCENQDSHYNQEYILTKAAYDSSAGKLKKMLESYYKKEYRIYVQVEEQDIKSGLMDYYQTKIDQLEGNSIVILPPKT